MRDTASGGVHIVCADAFDPHLDEALELIRVFDSYAGKDGKIIYFPKANTEQERRRQVVGCDYDGKELLYSNVVTAGY